MTMHQFRLAVEGKSDNIQRSNAWLAWHIAYLSRVKKQFWPKIETLMPRRRVKSRDLSNELLGAFRAYNLTKGFADGR